MSLRTKHIYEFGPFRLDEAEHLLLRDGKTVPLTFPLDGCSIHSR
jgi:hypothetical protein